MLQLQQVGAERLIPGCGHSLGHLCQSAELQCQRPHLSHQVACTALAERERGVRLGWRAVHPQHQWGKQGRLHAAGQSLWDRQQGVEGQGESASTSGATRRATQCG